jgi:hypothetical protein
MAITKTLNKWHKTRLGLLMWTLIEFAIAYGLASLSINTGNLWWYLLTILFFVGALKNLFKLIGTLIHGRHKTS